VDCEESLDAAIYFLHSNLSATRCWPEANLNPINTQNHRKVAIQKYMYFLCTYRLGRGMWHDMQTGEVYAGIGEEM